MKPRLIMICAMLPLSFCLPSCSGTKSVVASCNDFITNNHIAQQLEVTAGSSITLSLCSNPSTGFEWSESATIRDENVIQQINHEFVPPEAKSMGGAAGEEVWTFKALKKGISIVSLEYSRPWEGGEKGEWTYKLTITVK